MAKQKYSSKMRQKINELHEENEFLSCQQNRNRARSITVGTAFGGTVEVHMRSDAASVYAQMQPTEAIELIEQIAAGVGVEIAMRPKVNFASWRGWEEVIGQRVSFDKIAWKGAAAWQLDGQTVEENYQKSLESSKTENVSIKELSPSKNDKEEKIPTKSKKRTPRKKVEEENNV